MKNNNYQNRQHCVENMVIEYMGSSQMAAEVQQMTLPSTCDHPHAIIYMRSSTCDHPHAIIHMPSSTCDHPHAIIHMRPSTCDRPHAIIHMRSSTCDHPHAIIHMPSYTSHHCNVTLRQICQMTLYTTGTLLCIDIITCMCVYV